MDAVSVWQRGKAEPGKAAPRKGCLGWQTNPWEVLGGWGWSWRAVRSISFLMVLVAEMHGDSSSQHPARRVKAPLEQELCAWSCCEAGRSRGDLTMAAAHQATLALCPYSPGGGGIPSVSPDCWPCRSTARPCGTHT